jgi:hypothetical protein
MTLSAYLISLVFAAILALLFHVIVGGRGWRILFFVFCSWIGFSWVTVSGRYSVGNG